MLMPSPALLVELTSSKRERRAAGAGHVDGGTAGRVDVGRPGRRHRDGAGVVEQEARAAGRREREAGRTSSCRWCSDMLTPPLPEPVTVIWSNVLVPMAVPVASRPLAPALVIVMLLAGAKITVPALLSSTPVALLLTVKLLMLNVPVVALSSSPACVPAVPTASTTLTSSIVPPPVSPVVPAMPPPVPCGSTLRPRSSLPSSRSMTSASVAVSVGCAPAFAGCSVSAVQGAAAVGVDHEALVLADQPLAGVHRVAVGVEAGRRVVAVEHEHGVVGAGRGLGLRERVERCAPTCRCCRRCVVADVPDAAGDRDRDAAGVGARGRPGPAAFWSVTV